MKNKSQITFIVLLHFRAWIRYTRRPHFSSINKFANLIVVESPLIIFSNDFFRNFLVSIKNYLRYSKGIRTDKRSGAKIVRPILIFPEKLKNKFLLLSKIDSLVLNKSLNKALSGKYSNSVLCLTSRSQKWIIPKFKNHFLMLDINDEWSMMPYDKDRRPEIEKDVRKIIQNIDLATAVTEELKNKYNEKNNVEFIPNAVDVSHYCPKFDKCTEGKKEESIHEIVDLKFIEKEKNDPRKYETDLSIFQKHKPPFVGSYSGLSGNWSDFAFMSEVEKLLPSEFTMIASGNIHPPSHPNYQSEYKNYLANQRMLYLGYVDYSSLPNFLEKLNVSLVMHRADDFNIHSAPNKIWAYLAMGLPVVSTDFLNEPDKIIYEGLVKFAKTPREYVDFIIDEYNSDTIEKKMLRRRLAIKYSTDNRAKKIIDLIQDRIQT